MATRCNVLVKFGKAKIYLYRHWDGYPAECGAAIVDAFKLASDAGPYNVGPYNVGPKLCAALLALRNDPRAGESVGSPVYELTDSIHGDIEHYYEVSVSAAGSVKIFHAERPRGLAGDDTMQWLRAGLEMKPAAFAVFVNKERADSNARLAELAKTNKHYADASPYPMLALA